jgi:hypothetical protein
VHFSRQEQAWATECFHEEVSRECRKIVGVVVLVPVCSMISGAEREWFGLAFFVQIRSINHTRIATNVRLRHSIQGDGKI